MAVPGAQRLSGRLRGIDGDDEAEPAAPRPNIAIAASPPAHQPTDSSANQSINPAIHSLSSELKTDIVLVIVIANDNVYSAVIMAACGLVV